VNFKIGDKVHFKKDFYHPEFKLFYGEEEVFTVNYVDEFGFIKLDSDDESYWNEKLFERIEG